MCSGLPLRLWAAAPVATLKGGALLVLSAEGGPGEWRGRGSGLSGAWERWLFKHRERWLFKHRERWLFKHRGRRDGWLFLRGGGR